MDEQSQTRKARDSIIQVVTLLYTKLDKNKRETIYYMDAKGWQYGLEISLGRALAVLLQCLALIPSSAEQTLSLTLSIEFYIAISYVLVKIEGQAKCQREMNMGLGA